MTIEQGLMILVIATIGGSFLASFLWGLFQKGVKKNVS
jgi:hypothetical protein